MARYIKVYELVKRLLSIPVTDDLYGMGMQAGINNALKIINEIPTADVVEVKHGKWLKKAQRQKINGSIIHRPCLVCSICERKHFALVSYNYCPNCGAKMDGGKAE